ncbi:hypothetical protein Ae168Ps1_1236c [Pseudonocardia sp. Ae168_Ps1]|nr:hypothetical protein Ae150APs1_1233c [Pseudonocardia sp. Ae150A_Ps1]OLL78830.1 hypothetical protein Ae168Ps1_1236c [Pseudonocardia sp. Ae168_Ps1]OLL87044.1 hypothetical protein Ae263Ps1_4099 [Pseudonocardia sp. Ae263_Ps1]OLL92925.1 hypothetical protein Ae356Ps1_2822c [Pseudonocardia sp. Ae356_Ps1]
MIVLQTGAVSRRRPALQDEAPDQISCEAERLDQPPGR